MSEQVEPITALTTTRPSRLHTATCLLLLLCVFRAQSVRQHKLQRCAVLSGGARSRRSEQSIMSCAWAVDQVSNARVEKMTAYPSDTFYAFVASEPIPLNRTISRRAKLGTSINTFR